MIANFPYESIHGLVSSLFFHMRAALPPLVLHLYQVRVALANLRLRALPPLALALPQYLYQLPTPNLPILHNKLNLYNQELSTSTMLPILLLLAFLGLAFACPEKYPEFNATLTGDTGFFGPWVIHSPVWHTSQWLIYASSATTRMAYGRSATATRPRLSFPTATPTRLPWTRSQAMSLRAPLFGIAVLVVSPVQARVTPWISLFILYLARTGTATATRVSIPMYELRLRHTLTSYTPLR
jgi:hypothetical protein